MELFQQLEDFPPNYLAQWWERNTPSNSVWGQKNPLLLLANRRFLLEDGTDPTVPWYLHTDVSGKERAPFQPQPCQGLSFSTAREGQEGQPALHVWPEPGQHLSLFITQPCRPSALALDISFSLPSSLHRPVL